MTNIRNKNLIAEIKTHTQNSTSNLFMAVFTKQGKRFEFEAMPLKKLTYKGTQADANKCFDELEAIGKKYGFDLLAGGWAIEGEKMVFVGNQDTYDKHNKGEENA